MSSYYQDLYCPDCKCKRAIACIDNGKKGYWLLCSVCGRHKEEKDWNMSIEDMIDPQGGVRKDLYKVTTEDVLHVRGKTHGDYKEQGAFADKLKKVLEGGRNWDALDGAQRDALSMVMVKVSRILHGNPNERDHWRDIAGYSTLIAQMVETQKNPTSEEMGQS